MRLHAELPRPWGRKQPRSNRRAINEPKDGRNHLPDRRAVAEDEFYMLSSMYGVPHG